MKVGVFDSGIGGEAVANSLRVAFPDAEILVVNDREHLPYGNRTATDITKLTISAIQPLLDASCEVIVIACNSATATSIETLRQIYPEQLFIGLEPMVKPACALSKSHVVAICATPATLASDRYKKLKETYAQDTLVLEPDCSTWASMIERDQIDELIIKNTISDAIEQGADVIILACTHYHWIRETIESVADASVSVIDPSSAIIKRVETLLVKNASKRS
ncbi:MAG: aspartate/glutamate racemase family protein [Candidatus Saccharimonadales bacterium]